MATLTSTQLKDLEKQLRDRQLVLADEITEKRRTTASASTQDLMGGAGDPGDESVVRVEAELSIEEAGRDAEEMRDIDAALERIADGSYGTCDDCGNEIDYRRLQVQPTAIRCIDCQSQHEKTYASRGTPTL